MPQQVGYCHYIRAVVKNVRSKGVTGAMPADVLVYPCPLDSPLD